MCGRRLRLGDGHLPAKAVVLRLHDSNLAQRKGLAASDEAAQVVVLEDGPGELLTVRPRYGLNDPCVPRCRRRQVGVPRRRGALRSRSGNLREPGQHVIPVRGQDAGGIARALDQTRLRLDVVVREAQHGNTLRALDRRARRWIEVLRPGRHTVSMGVPGHVAGRRRRNAAARVGAQVRSVAAVSQLADDVPTIVAGEDREHVVGRTFR